MHQQQLQSFSGLGLGQRASAQIPPVGNRSVGFVKLDLTGDLAKANLTEVVLKDGSEDFFGPISVAALDKLMKYRGEPDDADYILLDLTDTTIRKIGDQVLGAHDLASNGGRAIFVEVMNDLGAGTVELSGTVGFSPRQWAKKPTPEEQHRANLRNLLTSKLKRHTLAQSGTRLMWHPRFDGDMVKRLHFEYTGTDWTSSTEGNIYSVEVRRGNKILHDRIGARKNRYLQTRYGRVPQSRWYTVDFVADGDLAGAMATSKEQDIEIEILTTAADTVVCYAETLGYVGNARALIANGAKVV